MSDKPKDDRQERKQEILMAALQAFSQKGFDKTSMADIVEVSGLSKGTLYWYYKNKEELFSSLIQLFIDQLSVLLEQGKVEVEKLSAEAGLRMVIKYSIDSNLSDENFITLILDFYLQSWRSKTIQQEFNAMYDYFISEVAKIIQKGIDNGEFRPVDAHKAATGFLGAFDGIFFQVLLKSKEEIMSVAHQMLDIFIQGLKQPETVSRKELEEKK